MATLAIRQSTWQAGTATQKAVLLYTMEVIGLGNPDVGVPPVYINPSAVPHFVFDDHRFTLRDAAIIGRVTNKLAQVTVAQFPLNGDGSINYTLIRERIASFIAATAVWPNTINYTGVTNLWQHTLTQNGAPTWVVMGGGIPAGWTLANVND